MCGISGIIDFENKIIPKDKIIKMVDSIKHRGPDNKGYFFDDNLAFGHARLSIIDLTEAGIQPMEYQDKYVIIHNGEIYNYLELKAELEKLGYRFRSRTDTEVIPASFDAWNYRAFSKFNGMWALALYDKERRVILFSRDRFGIKPFYYYFDGNTFIFSSEIKSILTVLEEAKANIKILAEYLVTRYEDHTNDTFFKYIKKLPQSSYALLDLRNRKFEIYPYYSLMDNLNDLKFDEKELKNRFMWLIEDSVRLRLRSDVKVGTCLSGGLDSSTVAALASRLFKDQTGGEQFSAITAISEDRVVDESLYARMLVEREDLKWITTKPLYKDFENFVEEVVYTLEEPFGGPSIFMSYFVMKAARENSVTVLLDGQGGDETLLGYERYYIPYLKELGFFRKLKEIPAIVSHSILSVKSLLSYYAYFANYELRRKILIKRANFVKKHIIDAVSWDEFRFFSELSLKEIQVFEIMKYQLPHLLKYEDKTSMRQSIETRLPFLDYRFVEFAVSLPAEFKIRNGYTKYILRSSMAGVLPNKIIWRTNKFGFEAPVNVWLNKHRNKIKSKILSSSLLDEIIDKTKLNFSNLDMQTLWQLYNITVWEKMYEVKV